jgi:hypothetical protein
MIVFSQLKAGVCGRIANACPDSTEFALKANAAVRQLMNRGDWWSNVAVVDCCVCANGLLVWPRGVSTILALNVCGNPTVMQNRWYNFRPMDREYYQWGLDHQRYGYCGEIVTSTLGTSPVFNQILTTGFKIRTFIRQPSDVGKKITWFGIDGNGQVVRTQRSDGTWQDGVEVTLANPSVDTPMEFQRVTRVIKDPTNDVLDCYQFNVAQGFLLDLAHYQPSETTPEYIVTKITGHRRGNVGVLLNNTGNARVTALVKLNFVPFVFDNDVVQIDNEDAIRDMIISLEKKEQGNIGDSQAMELSAIREMNRQSETKMPENQIVFENQTFGDTCIGSRRIY